MVCLSTSLLVWDLPDNCFSHFCVVSPLHRIWNIVDAQKACCRHEHITINTYWATVCHALLLLCSHWLVESSSEAGTILLPYSRRGTRGSEKLLAKVTQAVNGFCLQSLCTWPVTCHTVNWQCHQGTQLSKNYFPKVSLLSLWMTQTFPRADLVRPTNPFVNGGGPTLVEMIKEMGCLCFLIED